MSNNPSKIVSIRPPKKWVPIDFPELWRYRELFLFFVWRNFKVRYKQTLLGPIWAIIAPFMQMVVFTIIFGRLAKLPSDGLPAPIFYFAGITIWRYFASTLDKVSNSLVANRQLFTKIYFPRLIIPAGIILTDLIDFFISLVILLLMMLYYGIPITYSIIFLPILILITMGTALGIGAILACLNVYSRDVKMITRYLIQVLMYFTIIIPFSRFTEWATDKGIGAWKYLYGINPMAGVVEGFRWCLLHTNMTIKKTTERIIENNLIPETLEKGQHITVELIESKTVVYLRETVSLPTEGIAWQLFLSGIPVMIIMLIFGLFFFKRMEKIFADIV